MDFWTFLIIIACISSGWQMIVAWNKHQQMNELRQNNPEAWVRMQEVAQQERALEEERKRRRSGDFQTGMKIGTTALGWPFKK